MNIQIVSVGSKPRPAINDLITTYETRLPRTTNISWKYIKHGPGDANTSMQNESENILSAIPKNFSVVLLDETGTQLTSEKFAEKFMAEGKDLCFVIGGAYGVNNSVKRRADFVFSLSQLVFPHQLVRILLAEQIYRAHTIVAGHPYHHS